MMIQEPIKLKDFTYLMLATLAQNTKIVDPNNTENKMLSIPTNYKQIIKNILCLNKNNVELFSSLINMEEYFKNSFSWEIQFSLTLNKVLNELNKKIEYDLVTDKIQVLFTQAEIDKIMKNYPDDTIKQKMFFFTNLLGNFNYTKQLEETTYNHKDNPVTKMYHFMKEHFRKKNDYSLMSEGLEIILTQQLSEKNIPIVHANEILQKNKTRKRKK